jgi:hypothetical protein
MSGFSVARRYKPVLRTTSVAQRPHITTPALRSQHVPFVIPEPALLRGTYEIHQVCLMDVAQLIARLDEVIAGVNVTVVFQRRTISARRGVDAQQVSPEISFQCHIEHLHKNFAHIVPNPLLKDLDQESAVLFATH